MIPFLPYPEFSVIVICTDMEKVTEIDHYYQGIFSRLKLSGKLTTAGKAGQQAFLNKEWEQETLPFLNLWTVKIYQQQ